MSDKTAADCSDWSTFFAEAMDAAQSLGVKRYRGGGRGRETLDFGSNDYLGLRSHPAVQATLSSIVTKAGWGSGSSPVLGGHCRQHAELEAELAAHCQSPAALVFSSGYASNVGSLACLAEEADVIYSDSLNHASLIDGIRLSKATRVIFPHNAVEFLEQQLRDNRHRYRRALIVTESIFSMDGDRADLAALAELAQRFQCRCVVDEAHATGVYGKRGAGLLEELELAGALQSTVLLKLGTLSKALGSIGGFAAGSSDAVEFLVNRCRSYLFSTAPPPAVMSVTTAALRILQCMSTERQQLRATSIQLRERLSSAGWKVAAGDSPIVPVMIGDERRAVDISRQLAQENCYVPAIRPPTVPPGTSRLRISLSVNHTPQQIDHLCAALMRHAPTVP